MGLINWIFDIYQHSKIDDARREAAAARAEVSAIRGSGGVDATRLLRALEELALSTKTLQRVLVEKGICTQTEFATRLREIDLEDGIADGRTPIL